MKCFIDGFIEFVPSLETSDRKGYDGIDGDLATFLYLQRG